MRYGDEKLSDIRWETVRYLYREPMKQAMVALYRDLKENLPLANASEPFEMDYDDYAVDILCSPTNRERFTISLKLNDSRDFEGLAGGYNFSVDIVEEGGLILGGFAPYNYTEQCWEKTLEGIKNRFELVKDGLDFVADHIEGQILKR